MHQIFAKLNISIVVVFIGGYMSVQDDVMIIVFICCYCYSIRINLIVIVIAFC